MIIQFYVISDRHCNRMGGGCMLQLLPEKSKRKTDENAQIDV